MATKKTTVKKAAGNAAPNAPLKPPSKEVAPPCRDPQALNLEGKMGETMAQTKARAATKAELNSVFVINAYQTNIMGKDVDINELVASMQTAFNEVNSGDMSPMENMLIGQATALQTMFTSLAQRAASQEYLKQYQTYMTLALKAQAQSRATISALVDLKYPKQAATFVKQANIANGPQQVNNTPAPVGHLAHAEESETTPNKLLEGVDHERLDIGAAQASGRINQELETLGAVHRA